MPDQITEIATFYDKLRNKIVKRQQTELAQLQRARDAALRVFQKSPAAPANGVPRVRKSRLDPAITEAILAVLDADIWYTGKQIAQMSKASPRQVRRALATAINVITDGKRNIKYKIADTVNLEDGHASE